MSVLHAGAINVGMWCVQLVLPALLAPLLEAAEGPMVPGSASLGIKSTIVSAGRGLHNLHTRRPAQRSWLRGNGRPPGSFLCANGSRDAA